MAKKAYVGWLYVNVVLWAFSLFPTKFGLPASFMTDHGAALWVAWIVGFLALTVWVLVETVQRFRAGDGARMIRGATCSSSRWSPTSSSTSWPTSPSAFSRSGSPSGAPRSRSSPSS